MFDVYCPNAHNESSRWYEFAVCFWFLNTKILSSIFINWEGCMKLRGIECRGMNGIPYKINLETTLDVRVEKGRVEVVMMGGRDAGKVENWIVHV